MEESQIRVISMKRGSVVMDVFLSSKMRAAPAARIFSRSLVVTKKTFGLYYVTKKTFELYY